MAALGLIHITVVAAAVAASAAAAAAAAAVVVVEQQEVAEANRTPATALVGATMATAGVTPMVAVGTGGATAGLTRSPSSL